MVDIDIIQACKLGDRRSYQLLYNASAAYLFTIVKNYLSDDDDRKDVLQEIYAQIFLSIQSYLPEKGQFKFWAAKIAVCQCIAHLRKNKKINIDHKLELVDDQADTDFMKLEMLSKEDLSQMLATMPIGYKTIFLMSVIDEYSHKEIAEIMEITPETSRSQLFRASKWIKNNVFNDIKMSKYGLL